MRCMQPSATVEIVGFLPSRAWMASAVRRGHYLHCPDGSHMAMYDDPQVYARGLIDFIHHVDAGRFARDSAGR